MRIFPSLRRLLPPTFLAVRSEASSAPARAAPPPIADGGAAKPSVSHVPGSDDPASYWPASLAHLAQPYLIPGEDYVTLAEISETPFHGYPGYRKVSTALVPLSMLDEVLHSTAPTGWEIESEGPRPDVRDEGPPQRSGFWIEGFDRDTRFEPLIHNWVGSDTAVVVPDNNLLMVFGLVPRQTGEATMVWDDPHSPVRDVIRVSMVSDHQRDQGKRETALVVIRRDYLLEYCRIKQAAVVAFYFEERRSDSDPSFDSAIAGNENVDFHLPGRLLNLQSHDSRSQGRQLAQVWGRKLVVERGEQTVFVRHPELEWPDEPGPMTLKRASQARLMAFVSDEVLRAYQDRPEFEIHPDSGAVSYRNQWAVSFCRRIGRNYIQLELKKLYEGCPRDVIDHWHRFAISEAVAQAAVKAHGNRHIASRTHDLVSAYLGIVRALLRVSDAFGLSFTMADIGGEWAADVEGRGWWTVPLLASLSNVAPLAVARTEFLGRALAIAKFWESLKEAPLRNMVRRTGLQQSNDFRTLKLLAALCQLATLCKDRGLRWPHDAASVVGDWNPKERIPEFQRLFVLNQLRITAAHQDSGNQSEMQSLLKAFNIVPEAQASGWGQAVDALFDGLIPDFHEIATLLTPTD